MENKNIRLYYSLKDNTATVLPEETNSSLLEYVPDYGERIFDRSNAEVNMAYHMTQAVKDLDMLRAYYDMYLSFFNNLDYINHTLKFK